VTSAAEEGKERERDRRRVRHLEEVLERFGGEDGTGGPKHMELGKRVAKLEQELTISQQKVLSLQEVLQRSVPPERAAEVLGASLSAARALIPMAEEASAREAGLIAQVCAYNFFEPRVV
jgi:hypothetical protein